MGPAVNAYSIERAAQEGFFVRSHYAESGYPQPILYAGTLTGCLAFIEREFYAPAAAK